eukprot:TRINITY_DN66360_c0_g1_i1.p1 TRINITY_DN66360_c0_g1~~TRINITY_DN66360_c0_g1_i1.p1  ORF type:complete len:230 (+),score=79.72 TRINITY_DN66360_c0_g1_i1:166-855(+)
MAARCTRRLLSCGALSPSRPLLNLHINAPSPQTMDKYYRHVRRTPEVVHFTDYDGEEHTMTWEDFKSYQNEQRKKKLNEGEWLSVRMSKVPTHCKRLIYWRILLKGMSLEDAEANARFNENGDYGEIFVSMINQAKEKGQRLRGWDPRNVRFQDFIWKQVDVDKNVQYHAKGYYSLYLTRKYDLTMWFTEDMAVRRQIERMNNFSRWRYGNIQRPGELIDVPSIGLDGI